MKISSNKFNNLANALKTDESVQYALNEAGRKALKEYYELIKSLGDSIYPLVKKYLVDPDTFSKILAVQVISIISSRELGTEEFKLMTRLDALTNGGKTNIDTSRLPVSLDDNLMKYLEKNNI